MLLTPGDRLGAYEILGEVGSGGMGIVYRAHDSRVGRDVAIKIADERFSHHFEQEARAIAALNHPNICALYDVGPDYLVLELVEGEPLQSPQPIPEALHIARQLADALDAAHEHGITHRDLKPGNVRLTPQGTVKVLDFGLARTRAAKGHSDAVVSTTTEALPLPDSTARMGTVAYLSPEAARGEPTDKRADIWAFGVLLFELLAGRGPFDGRTMGEALAAISRDEPEWSLLPRYTPPEIRRLLRRCLEKDPRRRLPDIGVAKLEIDDAIASASRDAPARSSRRWLAPVAAMAAFVVGAGVPLLMRGDDGTATVVRFPIPRMTIDVPQHFPAFAVSPDGLHIVYAAGGRLNVRALDDLVPRPIVGTDSTLGISNPTFSPDGRSIAYFEGSPSGGAIKVIPVDGGTAVSLRQLRYPPSGMSWGGDGILFARSLDKEPKGIVRIAPQGGGEELLIDTGDEFVQGPHMLPDGETLVFTLATGNATDKWDKARLVAHSLRSGARTTLINGGADGRYLPTGHIMYALGTDVFVRPFDQQRLQFTGPPARVLQNVLRAGAVMSGTVHVAVSSTGTLAYALDPQTTTYTLALIEPDGSAEVLPYPPGPYRHPRTSPDGAQFAVEKVEDKAGDIWVGERGSTLRRLTFGGRSAFPVWSGDGTYLAFTSEQGGVQGIFHQRADGTGGVERLTRADAGVTHVPETWSPNSDWLLFREERGDRYSLWMY